MPDPEELARQQIDPLLEKCGWQLQDKSSVNLRSQRGVAVRELSFKTGEPDYTLFVDGKAIGTVEAKPVSHSLTRHLLSQRRIPRRLGQSSRPRHHRR